MKKVLFLALHRPNRSPSQRFRYEQYLDYLEANGYSYECSYLIREKDDKVFYGKGQYLQKMLILLRSIFIRFKDVWRAGQFDIAFVQRESFMLGTSYFERKIAQKTKMIYDFDDSIWLQVVSEGNKKLSFLKDASKTEKLIKAAHLIFAGNEYLANYARQFNQQVALVPTSIDTDEYQQKGPSVEKDKICIGWSGSFSTIEHFQYAIPALLKIQEKYKDRVCFKVVGDASFEQKELGIQGIAWTKETELKELASFDIGIMPLPDNEWTKGKCGLKGLSYMSFEVATIMSPVGVNTEIIKDGVNGFLADGVDEWVEKISRLIEDKALRLKMGKAGRQTVVDEYSVLALRDTYLKHFNDLTK